MTLGKDQSNLLALAQEIFGETYNLVGYLKEKSINEPDLDIGSTSDVWTTHSGEIERVRNVLYGLSRKLNQLLQGPHAFLHEYVASNWDHAALYALLECGCLEKIPLDGSMGIQELATLVGIPESKLLCVLRLNACEGILKEVDNGIFRHTAISEALVRESNFKAFVGFQLFETRVASAHLADTLRRKPNDYWTDSSAFHYAWGSPMYDWHKSHPEKGSRFQLAMKGVALSVDPGYSLLLDWVEKHCPIASHRERTLVVEMESHNEQICNLISKSFLGITFETRNIADLSSLNGSLPGNHLVHRRPKHSREPVLAYLIQNVLWNQNDEECIKHFKALVPVLQADNGAVLLVIELLSPLPGSFEPHVEKAYRRRDVTLMTMHNVKQRTESEWEALIRKASPDFQLRVTPGFTSHSSKGLWEIAYKPSA